MRLRFMSSIIGFINTEYHVLPHRNTGESDDQYKMRLRAYSLGMEVGIKQRQDEIEGLQKRIDEISNHVEINYDENRGDV